MTGPDTEQQQRRAIRFIWLGLCASPLSIALIIALLPSQAIQPVLSGQQLGILALVAAASGVAALPLLRRYRQIEASRHDLRQMQAALIVGAMAAEAPVMLGVAYRMLGGALPVFLALAASSVVFLLLFKPRH